MAVIRMQDLFPPLLVGGVSGAGQLFEDNALAVAAARGESRESVNMFLRNTGIIADLGLGTYGVVNHAMDFGFPRAGSANMMASGTAVASRRLVHWIGQTILGLRSASIKAPGRTGIGAPSANGHFSAYQPAAFGWTPGESVPMEDGEVINVTRT